MKLETISGVKLPTPVLLLLAFSLFVNFICVDGASCAKSEESRDYCATPTQPDDLDIKWLHEHADGWYLQFGNMVSKRFHFKLTGVGENPTDDSPLCLRDDLDFVEDHFTGYYKDYAYTKNLAFYNCTDVDCYFSNNDNSFNVTVKTYASYFDGKKDHNLITLVLCFENGDVGWHLLSLTETVSEEETKTILDHFKSIGFNPDLKIPFRTEACV